MFSVDRVTTDAHEIDAPSSVCISDSFGSVLDSTTWTEFGNSGVGARVDGGLLQLDVPEQTTAAQDPYGGIQTGTLDLTGAAFEVHFVQVPDAADPTFAGAQFRLDGTNTYSLFVQKGQLVARRYIAGTKTDMTWSYDPIGHAFLRLRFDLGPDEIVYETRAAASDWKVQAHVQRELLPNNMQVQLFAASYDIAPAYTAQFDDALLTGPSCH